MGVGEATGKDKAETAAKMAISSPLLETSICGSKGIIINITASPDISMDDIDIAASLVTSEAHEDATVIFGVVFDPDLEDTMKVTIIATCFENKNESAPAFGKSAAVDTKLRTVAAGKIEKGQVVKKETQIPETGDKTESGAEEGAKEEDSPISEDDFNEIINMLKKGRSNQPQSNNPPRRY